jgi:hypothetical protein
MKIPSSSMAKLKNKSPGDAQLVLFGFGLAFVLARRPREQIVQCHFFQCQQTKA